MFSDSIVWEPVKHQGGWLTPPMYMQQPCGQIGLYVRRSAVEDNGRLSARGDIRHIDDREAEPDEALVCDACGQDIRADLQRTIETLRAPVLSLLE